MIFSILAQEGFFCEVDFWVIIAKKQCIDIISKDANLSCGTPRVSFIIIIIIISPVLAQFSCKVDNFTEVACID